MKKLGCGVTVNPRQSRHVSVEGNVQGVGYRDFVRRWAIRLEVTGWVRNRSDGSVEALLNGSTGALVSGGENPRIDGAVRMGPRRLAARQRFPRHGSPITGWIF